MSLQARVLALVLSALALVWGGAALLTWRDVSHELDELLDGHLAQAAALLVAQQARALGQARGDAADDRRGGRRDVHGDDHADDDDETLDAPVLHRYAPQVAFQVFHEGRLVLRSGNAPGEPLRALDAGPSAGPSTVRRDGVDWRVFLARGAEADIQVLVGEQLASRSAIARAVLRGTLLPMAVALPVLAALLAWAVARGLAPLPRLRRQLAERRPDDLQPLPADDLPADLRPLAGTLNTLFGRIRGLLATERRFTADAAHELRTPVAAIRAQAQVALGARDEVERRHALQATVAGCDRTTRLIAQLLTLARLDAGEASAAHGRVDLATLARAELAEQAATAAARGQPLSLDTAGAGDTHVAGDALLLGILLRNLIDNALRYAPDGAAVALRLAREAPGGGLCLRVEDGGAGLPEADRARLGERFFRALGSERSGSGLGWSIVRRIAEVHGLQVAVAASPRLGGLAVTLRGWSDAPAGADADPAAGPGGTPGRHPRKRPLH